MTCYRSHRGLAATQVSEKSKERLSVSEQAWQVRVFLNVGQVLTQIDVVGGPSNSRELKQ